MHRNLYDSSVILFILQRSEKKQFRISAPPPARSGPAAQNVAVYSADNDAICCVSPLPRDRPLTTLKGRFAYSLTVVHFRKFRQT